MPERLQRRDCGQNVVADQLAVSADDCHSGSRWNLPASGRSRQHIEVAMTVDLRQPHQSCEAVD